MGGKYKEVRGYLEAPQKELILYLQATVGGSSDRVERRELPNLLLKLEISCSFLWDEIRMWRGDKKCSKRASD